MAPYSMDLRTRVLKDADPDAVERGGGEVLGEFCPGSIGSNSADGRRARCRS